MSVEGASRILKDFYESRWHEEVSGSPDFKAKRATPAVDNS